MKVHLSSVKDIPSLELQNQAVGFYLNDQEASLQKYQKSNIPNFQDRMLNLYEIIDFLVIRRKYEHDEIYHYPKP